MTQPVFYHATAARGFGPIAGPGADARPGAPSETDTVVVREGRVIDAGPLTLMRRAHGTPAAIHTRPGHLLLPGLINAHAHLELTAIGPQPYEGDFVGWVAMLRRHWPDAESGAAGAGGVGVAPFAKGPDPAWFAGAAKSGARSAAAAGVQAVGDIARFDAARAARVVAGLGGITFIELFGLGPPHHATALARAAQPADGFQPHAPYSAGPAVFAAAVASGRPVCTHLAETPEEARFVAEATGPFRDLLERIGKWSPGFADAYRAGRSPVQWMAPHLRRVPWLLAHANYVDDADIALLAETGASVAYCPVASEYFGHRGHRYRDLLDAGVNVCLGTDSVVCQPPGADPTQWLSVLPQMRHLYRRDGADPARLLEMATGRGRRALGLEDAVTRLCVVPIDGDGGDPLAAALRGTGPGVAVELSPVSPPA